MEEKNDWGGGGPCGAVEDVGTGGEGEVVYFDKGAGHGGGFFLLGGGLGCLVTLGETFVLWG